MDPFCPLCLSRLEDSSVILRICLRCKETESTSVAWNRYDRIAALHCRDRHSGLEDVWLSHERCTVSSPFWSQPRPEAPGQVEVPDHVEVRLEASQPPRSVPVDHWQIPIQRRLAGLDRGRQAAWFPHVLFRVVNESQRSRTLVGLLGPEAVGKTTLATMVFNQGAYLPQMPPPLIKDFVVTPRKPGEQESRAFLEALYRLNLLLRMTVGAAGWISPTLGERHHLKAAFFYNPPLPSPPVAPVASGPDASADAQRNTPPINTLTKPPRRVLVRLWRGFWDRLRDLMNVILEVFLGYRPFSENGTTPSRDTTLPRTLVLYDIAGELARRPGDSLVNILRDRVDVVAIMISASDLYRFGGNITEEKNSVHVANHHLDLLLMRRESHDPLRCLIVTKLDTVVAKLEKKKDGQEALQVIDDIRRQKPVSPQRVREAFGKWLSLPLAERLLGAKLESQQDEYSRRSVDNIFFVWTEKPEKDSPDKIPKVHGMREFVNWCIAVRSRRTS